MRRTTTAALAIATTAALLLTGCGSDDGDNNADDPSSLTGDDFAEQEPQAIIDAAEEATKGAASLRVTGTTVDDDGVESSIDIAIDQDGNCTGTIGQGSGSAEILGVDGQYWFRPDEAFWREQAGASADQVIAVVGDRFVVNDEIGEQVCDLDALLDDDEEDDESEVLEQDGTEDVDGAGAVKVTRTTDEDGTQTAFVLVDEPHYLVRIDDEEGSSISFTDFDEPVDAEAPAADDQIDLDELQG